MGRGACSIPIHQTQLHQGTPLVISTDTLSTNTGKYFLTMITSAKHVRIDGDVLISDLKLAGLPAESIMRPSKIATFEEAAFVRRIGTLAVTDRKAVSAQLREYLCVEEH